MSKVSKLSAIIITLALLVGIGVATANSPPNKPSSPSPSNGATGISINTDLSWSCSDPDGDTLVYDIYFDTQSPPQPVATNYSSNVWSPGTLEYDTTYYWMITAKDPSGETNTSQLWSFTTQFPNSPPTASFSYSANNLTVTFTDTSSDSDGYIVNWSWNFGDGNHSYEINPTHTYSENGTYTVTLTVRDNGDAGGLTNSTSMNITVLYGTSNNGSSSNNGNDNDSNGGGWFTWKLPFSWFAIFAIIFIAMIGIATSAFFLKPESIKALGYAPAAGTLLITIFIAVAIFMYYAGIAWYWIIADILVAIFILYIVLKLLFVKKKKVVRRLL